MNPLQLISVLAVIGMLLVLVGMARAIYSLGSTELDRRGDTDVVAQTASLQKIIRL